MCLVELITEGGNQFEDVGPVPKKAVPGIIKHVQKIIGGNKDTVKPLGSTGKKAMSGDVDLAIDETKHDMAAAVAKMEKEFGKGAKIGSDTVSFSVPYGGDTNAQVDLMFTPNMTWAEFGYWAESEGNSKYKGAIRTILIKVASTLINEPGIDHAEYNEDGELMLRVGRTFDMSKGLRRIYQHRPMKKKGDGYLKTLKTISAEEFQKLYPGVEIDGNELTIDDPNKVVQMVFGKGVKPADVSSAEKVMRLIQKKFSPEQQEEILQRAKGAMRAVAGKMDVPPQFK